MSLARDLGIKKGACARLTKELANYSEEAKTAAAKVASMRAAGAEPHDVKHAVSEKEKSLNGDRWSTRTKRRKRNRRRPVWRFLVFSSSHPLLPLFPSPYFNRSQQIGEHRRRVRPDGSGHKAAPGRHRGRHAEAPGERQSWFLSFFFFLSSFSSPPFLGTTLSLSCPVSHMISEQRKPI
jgi:hypothetical protein